MPSERVPYEAPRIVRREQVEGLLLPVSGDTGTSLTFSDCALKENIVAIAW